MEKQKKVLWLAVANVLASLGVVILHCNGVFWTFPKGKLWYTSNFIETFFYWPVPVFFMLSGATLVDYRKKYSTRIFFRKRFHRTVIPLLAWTVIGILYSYQYKNWRYTGFLKFFSDVINMNFINVYWFFIPLFAAYLSMPLLSAVEATIKIRVFRLMTFIGMVMYSVLPTVFKVLGIPYNQGWIPPVITGYMIYIMLGYLISHTDLSKRTRTIAYLAGIVGWVFQFEGTNILSMKAGAIDGTFKGYLNFPAVFQAIAVMTFIKYFPWEKLLHKRGVAAIFFLSKYTFGVYLMHIYLVWNIPGLMHWDTSHISFRTLGALMIFFISIGIGYLISRIPVLRKII